MSSPLMVVACDAPDYSAVGVGAANFAKTLSPGNLYLFTTTTNCFINQAGTASSAAGSQLVAAGDSILLHGANGATVSVIRDTADGKATITPVRRAF